MQHIHNTAQMSNIQLSSKVCVGKTLSKPQTLQKEIYEDGPQ